MNSKFKIGDLVFRSKNYQTDYCPGTIKEVHFDWGHYWYVVYWPFFNANSSNWSEENLELIKDGNDIMKSLLTKNK